MRICVMGVGNRWASDDAVGPEVIERLQVEFEAAASDPHAVETPDQAKVGDTPAVTFVTVRQPGLEMIEKIEQCDILMIVDAVVSGAPPGTVHRQAWQSGVIDSRGVERASSHGFGVREVLELAATLNKMPARVVLWGIEAGSTESGTTMSPAVEAALPQITRDLYQELKLFYSFCSFCSMKNKGDANDVIRSYA